MTFGSSHPRPGGSSAQHRAPPPSPTPPPLPSWRSAPRPKRGALCPATSQSPHPRPTDHPRPDQNSARVHQRRPRPPTNPRCKPTSCGLFLGNTLVLLFLLFLQNPKSKIEKPRRIFRRGINTWTLHKFEDNNPVQRWKYHTALHSHNWHSMLLKYSQAAVPL